jgi:peptidoglycan-associated lipoprotein
MNRILAVGALLALSLALVGCRGASRTHDGPGAGTVVPGAGSEGVPASSSSGEATVNTLPLPDSGGSSAAAQGGLLGRKVIYFNFDSSEIRAEFAEVIAAHAVQLAKKSALRLTLEGNTDERGAREYNIGLGERRAQAVRRALMLHGAPEAQLNTVSFGEERPAVEGEDEAAWAQNRRVELLYGK